VGKIKHHEQLVKIWQEIEESIVDLMTSAPKTDWKSGKQLLHSLKSSHKKPF
jgi:hypothetical protein